MFNVGYLSVQIRRFGLGVAVAALALTTVISPVAAAEKSTETGPITPKPDSDTSLTIPVKADIQVLARGKATKGNTTYYHFLIKNNGPANAPTINGYKEGHTLEIGGDGFEMVDNGYFYFGLNAGQSKAVTVICTPQAGYYCEHGTVMAFLNTAADPDTSNNVATIY